MLVWGEALHPLVACRDTRAALGDAAFTITARGRWRFPALERAKTANRAVLCLRKHQRATLRRAAAPQHTAPCSEFRRISAGASTVPRDPGHFARVRRARRCPRESGRMAAPRGTQIAEPSAISRLLSKQAPARRNELTRSRSEANPFPSSVQHANIANTH